MGFQEGSEDELLLTCFVCKSPFGMTSAYCGECGSNRSQALGIEPANTHQKIVQNIIEHESFATGKTLYETLYSQNNARAVTPASRQPGVTTAPNQAQIPMATLPTAAKPPKVKKEKQYRFRKLQARIRLRIDLYLSWQSRHANKFVAASFLMLLTITYTAVQGYIFANQSPHATAVKYLTDGIERNPNFVRGNTVTDVKYPIFPAKYFDWNASEVATWTTKDTWNGWTGKAAVEARAQAKTDYPFSVFLPLKAKYSTYLFVFRKVTWELAEDAPLFDLKYPSNQNLIIFINGYLAGTTRNPLVPAGKYYVYPGPLQIDYYEAGDKTSDSRSYFFDAYGDYYSNGL